MRTTELWARLRGEWLRGKLFLTSLGRVRIGAGFKAYGALRVIGQGRFCLGRNVTVGPDVFRCRNVSLQTQGGRQAVIEIGDGATLLGTHIACGRRVEIGPRAWIEDARIMDADFHDHGPGSARHQLSVEGAAPVVVGQGARIAGRAMVLKGARVGAGACLRPGAVVLREVPSGVTVSGFPAQPERSSGLGEDPQQRPAGALAERDRAPGGESRSN